MNEQELHELIELLLKSSEALWELEGIDCLTDGERIRIDELIKDYRKK